MGMSEQSNSDRIERVAVVGTGAVGGYYGARLQQSGVEVHFLLHRDYRQVAADGLYVQSPEGSFRLPQVNAYADARAMPPCELVIVALKTTANHLLPELLPPVLAPGGTVLMLQNGWGGEALAAKATGSGQILGGLCFICATRVAPGKILHLDYGRISLGAWNRDGAAVGTTEQMCRVADLFRRAGIDVFLEDDLALARWKKLVWNMPFNGMSVLHNARTDELLAHPQTRARCLAIMQEVRQAADACSRPIFEAFIRKMVADTERMKPYAPSMKVDFDHGRSMELEAIYAAPIREARSRGVEMPESGRLLSELRALERKRG
jgi:2-dehydropantoate 2-reductase